MKEKPSCWRNICVRTIWHIELHILSLNYTFQEVLKSELNSMSAYIPADLTKDKLLQWAYR